MPDLAPIFSSKILIHFKNLHARGAKCFEKIFFNFYVLISFCLSFPLPASEAVKGNSLEKISKILAILKRVKNEKLKILR